MQHATLALLQACLDALEPLLTASEARATEAAAASEAGTGARPGAEVAPTAVERRDSEPVAPAPAQQQGSWGGFLHRLKAAARARLPDPSTLVALLASLDKAQEAAAEGAGGIQDRGGSGGSGTSKGNDGAAAAAAASAGVPAAQALLLRHAALRALWWYCRWLPEAAADGHLSSMPRLLGSGVSSCGHASPRHVYRSLVFCAGCRELRTRCVCGKAGWMQQEACAFD